jgi:hypothetical protein
MLILQFVPISIHSQTSLIQVTHTNQHFAFKRKTFTDSTSDFLFKLIVLPSESSLDPSDSSIWVLALSAVITEVWQIQVDQSLRKSDRPFAKFRWLYRVIRAMIKWSGTKRNIENINRFLSKDKTRFLDFEQVVVWPGQLDRAPDSLRPARL